MHLYIYLSIYLSIYVYINVYTYIYDIYVDICTYRQATLCWSCTRRYSDSSTA